MNKTPVPHSNSRITDTSAPLRCGSRSSLLRSAREGNRDSITELIVPYATGIYRSGLRLTGNSHDAEDVRQESLLKALSRLDQFAGVQTDTRDDLHAWISRIATNTSIDVIRRRRDGKIFSLDQSASASDETFGSQIPSPQINPEQGFLRHETRRQLAAAITALPPDLRRVCLLLDVMHCSTQEVAQRLGISCIAVRLRLFRAHRKLREKFTSKSRSMRRRVATAHTRVPERARESNVWSKPNHRAAPCQAVSYACGAD